MRCWLCNQESTDADSTMGSMGGVPYHKSCARCPKCQSEDMIWKLWRDKLECFKCLNCGWVSMRTEKGWKAVHN